MKREDQLARKLSGVVPELYTLWEIASIPEMPQWCRSARGNWRDAYRRVASNYLRPDLYGGMSPVKSGSPETVVVTISGLS